LVIAWKTARNEQDWHRPDQSLTSSLMPDA
jgi:hypothetical protein